MLLNVAKLGIGLLSSIGAQQIVGYGLKMIIPGNISKTQKLLLALGGFAISARIGQQAWDTTDDLIDGTVALLEVAKDRIKNKKLVRQMKA